MLSKSAIRVYTIPHNLMAPSLLGKRKASSTSADGIMKRFKKAVVATVSKPRTGSKYSEPNKSGPERKHHYTTFNLNAVQNTAGTPIVTQLNGIAQGVTTNTRVGNKFVMKGLYYQIGIQCDLTVLATYQEQADNVKIAIVYDKQPNGALPTYATIFTCAGNTSDPFSLPNIDYRDRFSILSQDLLSICSAGPNAINAPIRNVKMNLPTKCIGTSAAITSFETGSLLIVAVAQYSTGDTRVTGSCRLTYTDE